MASRRSLTKSILHAAAGSLLSAMTATGFAASVTLGDQDYANGFLVTNVAAFLVPQGGEPAPIGTFCGSDPVGPSCSTSWTFIYAPGAVSSGSITLGIYDHDSGAAGNQVASFDVDGVDLTAGLNALFEGSGGTQGENNVYTLVLGGAALAALSDGSATFSLTLQGPGLQGEPGTCCTNTLDFNGAGLDFARLDINQANVPEPGALSLLGLGLVGAWWSRRRRS